ncbi:anti-sigma-I factor RsgI-like [Acropora muricata]|uniref:anti-sigma-I factor RsgI-like n=1 Tax=Acropora muricata TaxID=159855 RepID=UPI0034E5CBBE
MEHKTDMVAKHVLAQNQTTEHKTDMVAKHELAQNWTTEHKTGRVAKHILAQNRPENRTTKHKTDRVARHGLYKIMQYKTLNQGQEGKKPIKIDNTCRNPEVALRLRRRKLHENENTNYPSNVSLLAPQFSSVKCEKLGKLDVTCGVILDDDGKGTMDVFGHPKAVAFFEESNIAPKFYSYVNASGNDTNLQGGATQSEQGNGTENGHNGGTQTRRNNELQNGHGGETRTSTEPDNGTQNGHGGETRTSTEPDNGTQNGHGGETRTSTELDNGTQNGEGGETHTSTEPAGEPDNETQNGQSGETWTVQDNAVQNTESRTRRKKANKDRQYLQEP